MTHASPDHRGVQTPGEVELHTMPQELKLTYPAMEMCANKRQEPRTRMARNITCKAQESTRQHERQRMREHLGSPHHMAWEAWQPR